MDFEILTDYQVGVFYPLVLEERSGYVLYLTQRVEAEVLVTAKSYEPASHLNSGFKVGKLTFQFETSLLHVGYLFFSKLPVLCYGTGALSYSLAWQKSVSDHKIQYDHASLVFRNEHFFMYEVPTIATLITGAEVSTELDEYLTMI